MEIKMSVFKIKVNLEDIYFLTKTILLLANAFYSYFSHRSLSLKCFSNLSFYSLYNICSIS